jgi:MFS family permease
MQRIATKRALLFVTVICFWFAQYVYVPYQTPYLFSLGALSSFVGVILGAYGFTQMLLRIPAGLMADAHGRHKRYIIIGLLCSAIASVFRVAFTDPVAFLIANLFSGVASVAWISFTVYFTSLYDEDEIKKSMGYLVACNNGGIMLGFIAGALLNDYLGIKYVFVASIAAGAAGTILALFIRADKPQKRSFKDIHPASVFKSKPVIFYSILGIIMQAVVLSTALSFTTSYAKLITSEELVLGIGSLIFIATSAAVSLFIGNLKKWNGALVLAVLFVCLAVYCVFVPLSTAVWELYILQAIAGIGNGGLFTLLAAGVMSYAQVENKSTAMGYYQAVYSLGMTFGPMLTGALIGVGGYAAGFMTLAALSAAGAAIVLIGSRTMKI